MRYFLCLLLSCISLSLFAQKDYFQQKVNYKIDVSLDDKKHEITGSVIIYYTNNSPYPLSEIYIHLWPNAYKNNSTALAKQLLEDSNTDFYYASEEERGFIDELNFRANGENVEFKYDSLNIDYGKILLKSPVKKGETITITTPFRVKIPSSKFSRLGHDEQSYQITQWYPKPAVYDHNGWNAMPYLNQGEFYSEFGSFDVSITLPKNYVVGATGNLLDESEKEWLNNKAKETAERTTFSRILSFPESDKELKTLHFHEDSIHDFAWFADKRFHVAKSQVELPNSKRIVNTWALFTNDKPQLWINATNYINNTIYNYSLWNGDYPYNNVTVVDGALKAGSGMEYPGITVIGSAVSAIELETVIVHEVGHNWFYGILGSNERKYPWMDEGLNSFYETRLMMKKYPAGSNVNFVSDIFDKSARFINLNQLSHKDIHTLGYLIPARRGIDQALNLPSDEYSSINYGGIVYSKSAIALSYLNAYLGDTLFDFCMQAYYRQWKFKHPQPEDFRITIEEASGRKLDWFFNDLIGSTKKSDYKIRSIKSRPDSVILTLKNVGKIKGPVTISGFYNDSLVAKKWVKGFYGTNTVSFPKESLSYFRIDADLNMPEFSRKNNTIRTHGLFKKSEPLSFKLLAGIEQPYKTQIFYSPIAGWNYYDKIMAGMAFYNSIMPNTAFEYTLAPMYAFGSKSLTGSGNLSYKWIDFDLFQSIKLGTDFSRYSYSRGPFLQYQRLAPSLEFTFRKNKERDQIVKKFNLRSINLFIDKQQTDRSVFPYKTSISNNSVCFNEVSFSRENKEVLQLSNLSTTIQQGKNFVKAFAEINQRIAYKGKNRGFDIRIFAGAFLMNKNHGGDGYGFRMNAWNGSDDYKFDEIYLGRSEAKGVLSQQMTIREGGFKVPTILGQSNKWLTAINLKTSLPGRLPIRFFTDLGLSPNILTTEKEAKLLYDGGFELTVVQDIFSIYFPVFMSGDIEDNFSLINRTFKQTIRFELNLNKLNPLTFIRNFTL